MTMYLSPSGTAFIKNWEKCRLTAYRDSGGKWTIGWGHTGSDVHAGLTWTQEQADREFLLDTTYPVYMLNKLVTVTLNQNQFDALVSFIYNIGTSAFASSTLLRKLNDGNIIGAALEFPRWHYDNGIHSNGLANRRAAEAALFTSPSHAP